MRWWCCCCLYKYFTNIILTSMLWVNMIIGATYVPYCYQIPIVSIPHLHRTNHALSTTSTTCDANWLPRGTSTPNVVGWRFQSRRDNSSHPRIRKASQARCSFRIENNPMTHDTRIELLPLSYSESKQLQGTRPHYPSTVRDIFLQTRYQQHDDGRREP